MTERDDANRSEYDRDTRFAYRKLGGAWWLALLLVPLILAGILAATRGGLIESNLRDRSLAALQTAGFSGIDVTVDGRDVTLKAAASGGANAIELEEGKTLVSAVHGVRVAKVDTAGAATGAEPSADASVGATPTPDAGTPSADAAGPCSPETLQPIIDGIVGADNIVFAKSQARLVAVSQAEITKVVAALKACTVTLKVEGHTPFLKDKADQMDLSGRRAQAVRDALTAGGVTGTITAEGVGFQPMAGGGPRNTSTFQKQNRSATITVEAGEAR